ncbi:myosin heavy chain-related protein [Tanacetum coccineum]
MKEEDVTDKIPEAIEQWPNLCKHNHESYAYSSHLQAVFDCLRNRSEWSRLIDRSPKNLESEDDYSTDRNSKEDTSDNPKRKRKTRKQRRLKRGTNDPGSIAVTQAMANEFSSGKVEEREDKAHIPYARKHFLFPTLNIKEYNDHVMVVVRAEAQDAMLQKLLNDKAISDEESNNLQEQQRSSKCDWLDGSVHELSADDSSMTSQRETLLAEISEEGSPDDVIRKLKGELVILSRQAKVSDMELQTLHKQIVKESKKGQDLSKEVASLKEERKKLKEEFEKMKVKVNINSNLSSEGGDPWALVDELKQELNYEKDLNTNLRLQVQKTQESNAKLILVVQDVDEMLEHKHKSNCSVDPKSQEVNTKRETDDDDEDQKALMEIVGEHSGLHDVHLQEQKIIDLYNEIELYKRDKDELEMQMEQIALESRL